MDAQHEKREEIPEDEYEDGAERASEKDTIALEDMPEIVIVTGMSGAGRTEAMQTCLRSRACPASPMRADASLWCATRATAISSPI